MCWTSQKSVSSDTIFLYSINEETSIVMPRDIDLDLLALNDSAARDWLVKLQRLMPWLAAYKVVPPKMALLKAVGTRARLYRNHQLELLAAGTFGDEAHMLLGADDWSWR